MSDPQTEADPYLTAVETAKLLKVSPKTLERFRSDGTGPPYFKLAEGKRGRILYKREDITKWLEHRRFGSTSEY